MNKSKYASVDKFSEMGENFFARYPIIPDMSVFNALSLISLSYRNDTAINCLNLNINYDQLLKNAKILSRSLKELGIRANDIIVVSMPNFYQAVLVYLAANRIGAITTFLNSFSTEEEVQYYLNLFESPLFINYEKCMEYNTRIKSGTKVRQIITLHEKDLSNSYFDFSSKSLTGYSDFLSFSDLGVISTYYRSAIKTNYRGNQDSIILFTSGSTGNPKSVVLTNKNIMASGIYMKNSAHIANTKGEKSLVCVPFSYPYGFATSTLMSLLCGRQAILAPNLSKDNICYYLSKEPNIIFGSPALLELIMRNASEDINLSSISTFISGGDFLTLSQQEAGIEFFRRHNSDITICNGSGNAETVGASTNAVGVLPRPETVGKILVGTNAIIINPETGIELRYGEEGLLCVAGEHIFKEYYHEEELTNRSKFVFKGKTYFRTGTLGYLDKEGYFYLTGRDSRYYIISTLNKIYCDHVQNIISAIDVVDSCAVVKQPDDSMLFVGKAYIVLKQGILPTNEVLTYIKEQCHQVLIMPTTGERVQLKPYEIPSSFEFVDSLPRTKADKVDYALLEKEASLVNRTSLIKTRKISE